MVWVRDETRNGYLVRTPGVFDRFSVHYLWPGPALRRSQDDHWPHWESGGPSCAGVILNRVDFLDDRVERMRHQLVHGLRLMAFHKIRLVTIAGEKLSQLRISETAEYRRIRDLVPVQMQNWKNSAVASGIQKLVRVPTGCEWTRLGFAVTNHAANQQVWVVKGSAIRVRNRVSEFSSFMNRARRLRCDMAWNTSRERELFEKPLQAPFSL